MLGDVFEHNALQMVKLVAKSARKQLFTLNGEFLTVSILRLELDVIGTRHDSPLSREGQAALVACLLTAESDDLGVDKLDQTLADIDNDDAPEYAYLRRCKTDGIFC